MLGYVSYEVKDSSAAVLRFVSRSHIPSFDMREEKGVLYLTVMAEHSRLIEEFMTSRETDFRTVRRRGLIFGAKRIFRAGLVAGGLFAAAAVFMLSNIIFRFEILTDDERIRSSVMAVLDENGVSGGSFIPSLNLTVLERELKQRVEGISWAGITTHGTTLIIDVVENVEKPEQLRTRMPSDLAASYDAVVDKIEVYDGQIVTTVGSGVRKGDILVSGTVVTEKITYKDGKEIKNTKTRYTRSLGTVYGTFTRRETFFQPFETEEQVLSGETDDIKFLSLYDVDIPLFFGERKGRYIETTRRNDLSLLGFTLPLKITETHLEEFYYRIVSLTEEEAKAEAYAQAERFEKNFLEDYEIKDISHVENVSDEGIELTVEYTLYGVISEEKEFFMPKNTVKNDKAEQK